jgi:hypothetical protein
LSGVYRATLPEDALVAHYHDNGDYTDCYALDVPQIITQSDYIRAFYTSWLFKVERWILGWAVAKPSTDAEADALANSQSDCFSAWTVEARTNHQLVMCDYQKRTRSWLMTAALLSGGTRLYFGTAYARFRPNGKKDSAFGLGFYALLWFHKLYSRALLRAAQRNL